MKRLVNGLLGCILGMIPVAATAQSSLIANRGETVDLKAADGYTDYQWQVSSDKKHFVDLPTGKVQHLKLKVYAPGYYRIRALDNDHKMAYLDTLEVAMKEVNYAPNYSVSGAGHGYVETIGGVPDARGIDIPEDRVDGVAGTGKKLTKWTNGDAMAVYFFNHPQDTVDTEMYLKVRNGAEVSFRVKVYDPDHMEVPMAENIIALRGTGNEQKVNLVGLAFPRKAYFRYQLECLKGWGDIMEISKFHHYSPSIVKTYKAAYLSSPSVHLNGWKSTDPGAPVGSSYDWCYQEVMMPKESDIKGTYVMSLGVLKGYMGIQMSGYDKKTGESLHGVIFSMWDDGSTDENPDLPMHLRANVVDHNENVVASRFGNEGTGMKTYMHGHNWECGTFVQFLTNCRKERYTYKVVINGREHTRVQYNNLVSTWFNAQDGKGWQYMATLRIANKSRPFASWYSFLENYNYPTGQAMRKGFYRNGYGHAKDKNKWFHFNSVGFGHTDGGNKVGARNDFSQGASDEIEGAFFMSNGGYVTSKITDKVVPLNKVNTPVDTINLAVLEKRVDQAIAFEKQQIEKEELFKNNKIDKSRWELIDFSSEEKRGEGSNGRAAQTIDGDVKTYWHTQWLGGRATYPHHLTVDMKETYSINGMEITMSGSSNRYIKAFNLYVSENNSKWNKIYSENDAPNMATFRFMLDKPVAARYFKLEVTDGRATDGNHIRINEMELSGTLVQTGFEDVVAGKEHIDVMCGQKELSVVSHKELNDVKVALFRTDGACVFSAKYKQLSAGEVVSIPMMSNAQGGYVLSCQSAQLKYTKQIVWKK